MKERTTQALLTAVALLLVAQLMLPALPFSFSQVAETAPAVIRAQSIELVNEKGEVRAQLYLGEDGGGNLRLRDAEGTVRVKLGATADGSGLLLFDKEVEPAVWAVADQSGTRLTLAEKGKEKRVLAP